MENPKILESLFDKKVLRILKLFYKDKDKEFYLREISKDSGVPIASTFRIINKLVSLNLINIVKVSRFKLYKLSNNKNTQFLETFLKEGKRIVQYFIDQVKKIPQIDAVVLHGKEEEDKANLLLIGQDIDPNTIKQICGQIKEQYKFTISALPLTKEQFSQMSSMGLYSGKKKLLFKR